jgi:hypothetical protein
MYLVNRNFDSAQFLELTDLSPTHPRFLQLDDGGVDVQRTYYHFSCMYVFQDVERVGYILKPRNDVSDFKPTFLPFLKP